MIEICAEEEALKIVLHAKNVSPKDVHTLEPTVYQKVLKQ